MCQQYAINHSGRDKVSAAKRLHIRKCEWCMGYMFNIITTSPYAKNDFLLQVINYVAAYLNNGGGRNWYWPTHFEVNGEPWTHLTEH